VSLEADQDSTAAPYSNKQAH